MPNYAGMALRIVGVALLVLGLILLLLLLLSVLGVDSPLCPNDPTYGPCE